MRAPTSDRSRTRAHIRTRPYAPLRAPTRPGTHSFAMLIQPQAQALRAPPSSSSSSSSARAAQRVSACERAFVRRPTRRCAIWRPRGSQVAGRAREGDGPGTRARSPTPVPTSLATDPPTRARLEPLLTHLPSSRRTARAEEAALLVHLVGFGPEERAAGSGGLRRGEGGWLARRRRRGGKRAWAMSHAGGRRGHWRGVFSGRGAV